MGNNTLVSLRENNIFEQFYSLISENQSAINKSKPPFIYLHDQVSKLEQALANQTIEANVRSYFRESIITVLENFLIVFKFAGLADQRLLNAFIKYLKFLLFLTEHASNLSDNVNTFNNFQIQSKKFPITDQNWLKFDPTNTYLLSIAKGFIDYFVEEIENIEVTSKKISIYCNNHSYTTLRYNNDIEEFVVVTTSYYFLMNMYIENHGKNVASLAYPLWLISLALESIDGVTTQVLSITSGSLLTSMKVWMRDLISKEDVKHILTNGKRAAIAHYIEKPINDNMKTASEVKKVNLETELQEIQLASLPAPSDAQFITSLEIEKKSLENKKLSIENEKLLIENEMAKLNYIERLSELVSRGIVGADSISIEINSIPFLHKKWNVIDEKKINNDLDNIIK